MAQQLPYDPDEESALSGRTPSKGRSGISDMQGGTRVVGPSTPLGGIKMGPGVLGSTGHVGHSLEQREVKAGGRPGAARKYIPNPRAPQRIVEPTTLLVDNRKRPFAGVQPKNVGFNMNVHGSAPIGTTVDLQPWYTLSNRLKINGVDDFLAITTFIALHGERGSIMPLSVQEQLALLAQYGDHQAGSVLQYAQQVANAIQRQLQGQQ